MKKQYRFFYHYYKQKKKMSVHFRGNCYVVDRVVCYPACETKWSKTQPILRMQGFANNVKVSNTTAIIYE